MSVSYGRIWHDVAKRRAKKLARGVLGGDFWWWTGAVPRAALTPPAKCDPGSTRCLPSAFQKFLPPLSTHILSNTTFFFPTGVTLAAKVRGKVPRASSGSRTVVNEVRVAQGLPGNDRIPQKTTLVMAVCVGQSSRTQAALQNHWGKFKKYGSPSPTTDQIKRMCRWGLGMGVFKAPDYSEGPPGG